jgi:methionyl-tRNA formyltransferase
MLRVVFWGMELRILDALRQWSVSIVGVYLPQAPYSIHKQISPIAKWMPRIIRKAFKKAALYRPLADYIKDHGLKPILGADVNRSGFLREIRALDPDLGIVANFGQIISPELLSIPKNGFINFHPSILPYYRGPNPLGDILLNREAVSGATWHRIIKGIDSGDIVAQECFAVQAEDTLRDLEERSVAYGIKILKPLLKEIETGAVQGQPQNGSKATYVSKLTREKKKRLRMLGKF